MSPFSVRVKCLIHSFRLHGWSDEVVSIICTTVPSTWKGKSVLTEDLLHLHSPTGNWTTEGNMNPNENVCGSKLSDLYPDCLIEGLECSHIYYNI